MGADLLPGAENKGALQTWWQRERKGQAYGQTTPSERVERLRQSAKKEQKRWTEKWEQTEAESGGGCGEVGRNTKAKNTQTRSREKGAGAGIDYLP